MVIEKKGKKGKKKKGTEIELSEFGVTITPASDSDSDSDDSSSSSNISSSDSDLKNKLDVEGNEGGRLSTYFAKKFRKSFKFKRDGIEWTKQRYIKSILLTILFYYVYLCVGFLNAIMGPMFKHMQSNTGMTDKEIEWVLSMRGAGLVIGTPISGWVFNQFKKNDNEKYKWYSYNINRVLITSLIFMASTLMVVPFVKRPWVIMVDHLLQGSASAIAEVGCNLAIAWVWRGKVGPFLQGLHCFSGLGSLTFPLIISQIFKWVPDPNWQIGLAYGISCILMLLGCIPLLFSPAPKCAPMKKSKKSKEKGWKKYYTLIFSFQTFIYCLTAVIKGTATGGYSVFGNLIYKYTLEKGLGTQLTLVNLTTAFWTAFTIGRFCGIFLVIFVPPFFMMLYTIGGTLYSCIIMLFFNNRIRMIWATTILQGFCVASISASSMALPQTSFQIPLNSISTSIVAFGSTTGEMIIALIVNGFTQSGILGKETLTWCNTGIFTVALAAFLSIFIFGKLKMRKDKNKEEKGIEDEIDLKILSQKQKAENDQRIIFEDNFKGFDSDGGFHNKVEYKSPDKMNSGITILVPASDEEDDSDRQSSDDSDDDGDKGFKGAQTPLPLTPMSVDNIPSEIKIDRVGVGVGIFEKFRDDVNDRIDTVVKVMDDRISMVESRLKIIEEKVDIKLSSKDVSQTVNKVEEKEVIEEKEEEIKME